MIKLSLTTTILIAAGFLAAAIALNCVAGATVQNGSPKELSHVVRFELGTTYLNTEDRMTIEQVRGNI
jgi:hypothetical protein